MVYVYIRLGIGLFTAIIGLILSYIKDEDITVAGLGTLLFTVLCGLISLVGFIIVILTDYKDKTIIKRRK